MLRACCAAFVVLAAVACAGEDGVVGSAGEGGNGGEGGAAAGGKADATTATGAGGGPSVTAGVSLPATMPLPYVVAGAGAVSASFTVTNHDAVVRDDLAWSLSGDVRLSLVAAPAELGPGETATLTLAFEGEAEQAIASAQLVLTTAGEAHSAAVYAVAGSPALPPAAWEAVRLPGDTACGDGVTLALPSAPFPHGSAGYDDASVRVFVPDGLRDVPEQDVVVHFHGHNTTLAATLSGQRYQQHFCASGANGVLVVPQGPVNAASGDFGKLMTAGGLAALLEDVLVVLYREQRITQPRLGELALTAHSGGYRAVAANLDPAVNAEPVRHVHLFDALYGELGRFEAYVGAGGALRSSYTPSGGTVVNHTTLATSLQAAGHAVTTEPTARALREEQVILYPAATSHNAAVRIDGAYGEHLRWAMRRHRRGPRAELRQALPAGTGKVKVSWLAPFEEDLSGFVVQQSGDGGATWQVAAEVEPDAASVTFALDGSALVRVVPVVPDLDGPALASDTYPVDSDPAVLIVDGFDRVLDGSFGGLQHDFAARVGLAVGPVASASNEAVAEGEVALAAFGEVVWLLGDESRDDHAFTAVEQDALAIYLDGGGALLVSGSEAAFSLDASADGEDWLAWAFGATLVADDSGASSVTGVGPLAGMGVEGASFGVGPTAPYPEDFPDALGLTGDGVRLLRYDGSGSGAAVGIPGRAVLVGFPLELVDDDDLRATVAGALLSFLGG